MANVLKRKPASENREYAAKGLASIRCGKDVAKITFLSKDKKGNEIVWDNGETSKKFHKEDLPDGFQFEPHTEAEYYVCTTFDKSEVFAIGPWEGTFDMRVHDFTRPEKDADPAPYLVEGVDKESGRPYSGLWWKAQWKIVEPGEFKGCIVIQRHVYQSETAGFEQGENGMTQWRGQTDSERAKWQPRLEKFCEKHNAVDEDIPWDDDDGNILPILFDRVMKAPVKVHRMKVEKGEVVDFADIQGKRKVSAPVDDDDGEFGPNPYGEPDDVDEAFPPVEEEVPAKKNGKKASVEDDEEVVAIEQPRYGLVKKNVKSPVLKKAIPAKKVRKNEPVEEDDDL